MFYGFDNKFTRIILILAGSEFFTACVFMLGIEPDPSNAILLGYSAARLGIIGLSFMCGATCWLAACHTAHWRQVERIQNWPTKHHVAIRLTSVSLFLLGWIILLTPSTHLGEYSEYFERIQPLLFVLTILPFQFFIPIIFAQNRKASGPTFRPAFITLLSLLMLLAVIVFSRLGIEPDTHFWNVAGVPLTLLQLVVILLVATLCFYASRSISPKIKLSANRVDLVIALAIYVAGVLVWAQTPMTRHFFSPRPGPPAFEYFPYSDARMHDLGAISILKGYGINFGRYTDKPLYMVFLAILHLFSSNNYNLLSTLHLACMAVIPPALFWFSRNFHSRHFGIAIALTVVVRQENAIFLSNLLSGTNPRLLITELPTMLGLILFFNVVFSWFEKATSIRSAVFSALLAGSLVGAMSLLRLNPLGLLPVILVVVILRFWGTPRKWLPQILAFTVGFLLVFTPWVLSGRDSNGNSYLWVKILDVINVRYFSMPLQSTEDHQRLHRNRADHLSNSLAYEKEIPNFIINHSLHNIVNSFLTLPDSFSSRDQELRVLMERPYFDEKKLLFWDGRLQSGQILFIGINLMLVSMGAGWSWSRWKWTGIFPAAIFVGYAITLGFARSSGARYIVPIDWIVFFYYILGIIVLIDRFSTIFQWVSSSEEPKLDQAMPRVFPLVTILIVSMLSVSIPIAQLPIITKSSPACEKRIRTPDYPEFRLVRGQVLYPYLESGSFTFIFLACNQITEVTMPGFTAKLQHGQTVVIAYSSQPARLPEILFFEENGELIAVWHSQP